MVNQHIKIGALHVLLTMSFGVPLIFVHPEIIQAQVFEPAETEPIEDLGIEPDEVAAPGGVDEQRAVRPNGATLPTPKGLESDVIFWEKVFSEYSPDQCIFHDEWNLDAIYYVESIPQVASSRGSSKLKSHLLALRTAFKRIYLRGYPLGAYEQRIFQAVPIAKRNRAFFANADERVRCQRGVQFEDSLRRSVKLIPSIKSVLKEKGLPEDLAYLPHLESGFNTNAVSRAGAKGLWQFMSHTARSEGLRVRRGQDWRFDPVKSTQAATDYLASIFSRVKCWELAITSYNYGPNGVVRAVKKFGPDYMRIRQEHRTKLFGFAARNYYPSFLAARNVAKRAEAKTADMRKQAGNTIAEEFDLGQRRKIF
jgi:membrane-bound lytic murein transglycosylase D